MYKILNTKEIVLDKKLLKEYLAKLAADSIIKEKSSLDTYPILGFWIILSIYLWYILY